MPIYEYRCTRCGHQQEFLQKLSDEPIRRCTSCGKDTFAKMVTAAGFQLKGSGWYATDFKGPAKPAPGSGEAAKPAQAADSGDAAKSADAPKATETAKSGTSTGSSDGAKPGPGKTTPAAS